MDSGTVIVVIMTLAAAVFLVYAERNWRCNDAKREAESAAKAGAGNPPGTSPDGQAQEPGRRKSS